MSPRVSGDKSFTGLAGTVRSGARNPFAVCAGGFWNATAVTKINERPKSMEASYLSKHSITAYRQIEAPSLSGLLPRVTQCSRPSLTTMAPPEYVRFSSSSKERRNFAVRGRGGAECGGDFSISLFLRSRQCDAQIALIHQVRVQETRAPAHLRP